jgi:sodium transport system ATP-binding protein
MIHVRQIRKTYPDLKNGQFVALDGISFDAMPGQIFGLLGPNGAGKTTALRILSTVLKPTSGTITVNGFEVNAHPDQVRHQIGFVSTNTAIYDRMTAWEMVEYFGRLYGIAPDTLQQRMEQLFERFQMNEIRNTLGSKMSTGMKQKVSIVRAMVHNPPVLVFDEATSGLDILVAREVLSTVEQLRDFGKCILFSSHIMTEVRRLCDHVAIMNRGRILAQGSIQQLSEKFEEDDLEELFYQLISQSERDQRVRATQPSTAPSAAASSAR